jgi:LPXTG-site transpeptidase (sortase) family protein
MLKQSWFDRHVRKFNRLLLMAIILLNAYVLLVPLMPQVTYQVAQAVSEPLNVKTPEARAAIKRDTDHVIIPRISLDQKIWFGNNPRLVHKGVWHIPKGSTPGQGSNTVLVGHRFTYKDLAPFYHLDKVEVDDPIIVVYKAKLYNYKVTEKKIVNPTDVYVEDPTQDERLTLYTCHPLWSARQRLVVVATLESTE